MAAYGSAIGQALDSRRDIEKGSRGLLEIAKALDGIKVGITCLTPENLLAPWVLFEAGSLSKTIDDSTRLCTYLLDGLKPQDIEPPLSQFQHTSPNEKETRELVGTINKAVSDDPLDDKTLDVVFSELWPRLEERLESLPKAPRPAPKRSTEDMLAEILEFTRSENNRRTNDVQFFRYVPQGLTISGEGLSYPPGVFGVGVDLDHPFRKWELDPSGKSLIIEGAPEVPPLTPPPGRLQ